MDSIIIDQLTKKFGSFTAVDKVSLRIQKGEIFGLLGANGAGKTTLIKILTGLSGASSGKATVAGFDIHRQVEKVKMNIGYMSQKFSLYEDLTVRENIQLFGGIYGVSSGFIKTKTTQVLDQLGLQDSAKKLVKSLPLGWRQKLAFSVAIFHEPKIVFLDEPTSGVDPITRRQFWEMIYAAASQGITVLVTTHYMDEASYCDRIAIMNAGKVEALGSPGELKAAYQVDNIEDVFIKIVR
jgi:ABC-2 type transport system ATP-binding protein